MGIVLRDVETYGYHKSSLVVDMLYVGRMSDEGF